MISLHNQHRKAAKKVLFLMAGPLRPYPEPTNPPPSSLMAALMAGPLTPSLNGLAINFFAPSLFAKGP